MTKGEAVDVLIAFAKCVTGLGEADCSDCPFVETDADYCEGKLRDKVVLSITFLEKLKAEEA